jgi:hypothetical protein
MTSQEPVPTTLPAPPPDDFLNPSQWDILYALLDGALPSITSTSALKDKDTQISLPDEELHRVVEESLASLTGPATKQNLLQLIQARPINDTRFRDNVLRKLSRSPPEHQRRLAGFLSLMA